MMMMTMMASDDDGKLNMRYIPDEHARYKETVTGGQKKGCRQCWRAQRAAHQRGRLPSKAMATPCV